MVGNQDKVVRAEYVQNVTITAIKLQLDRESKVDKVRFTTDKGDITYKPRQLVEQSSEVAGFTTVSRVRSAFTTADYVLNDPFIGQLNKLVKKGGNVLVTMTYKVMTVAYPDGDKDYRFMDERLYKLIYCKAIHKDNLNLEAQKALQKTGIDIPEIEEVEE